MSSDHTESVLDILKEIADYDNIEENADVHPRHSYNSEDTDTALLTEQLASDHSNGKQSNSEQKESTYFRSHLDTDPGDESSSNKSENGSDTGSSTDTDSEIESSDSKNKIENKKVVQHVHDSDYTKLPSFKKRATVPAYDHIDGATVHKHATEKPNVKFSHKKALI